MEKRKKIPEKNMPEICLNTLSVESLFNYLRDKASKENYKSPIYETEILKHFFLHGEAIMNSGDSFNLFKIHFILYHYLYKLKSGITEEPYNLHIHLASIYFEFYPGDNQCPYFDETELKMCLNHKDKNAPYCVFHADILYRLERAGILLAQPMDNYYLNLDNLESMNKQELEYMLSTWKALCFNPGELLECYEELGLVPGADLKKITGRYYNLAKKYHPDTNKDPQSHHKMNRINHAYKVLSKAISLN